jgi:uncharacterized cupredoxin-like copper-binding protein
MHVFSLHRRAKLWAVAAATGLLVAGYGAVYAQQAITEQTTEFAFSQPTLTATAGQPVAITINNTGQFPHTIAFDDATGAAFATPPPESFAGGASGVLNVTFSKPGTYDFWCPVDGHRDRGMVGKITIVGGAGRAGGLDPVATAAGLAVLGVLAIGAGVLRRSRATAA